MTRLHAEDESVVADDAQGPKGDSAMVGGAEPGTVVPYRRDVSGPVELAVEYQRVLAVMEQADGPLRCKQICERLQIGTEARKVEAMRSRPEPVHRQRSSLGRWRHGRLSR